MVHLLKKNGHLVKKNGHLVRKVSPCSSCCSTPPTPCSSCSGSSTPSTWTLSFTGFTNGTCVCTVLNSNFTLLLASGYTCRWETTVNLACGVDVILRVEAESDRIRISALFSNFDNLIWSIFMTAPYDCTAVQSTSGGQPPGYTTCGNYGSAVVTITPNP